MYLYIFIIHNAFTLCNMFNIGIYGDNSIKGRYLAMYSYAPLWRTMQERGVTTYSLVNHHGFSSHLMSNLRHNRNVTIETIHRLCQILQCTPNDIIDITFDENI